MGNTKEGPGEFNKKIIVLRAVLWLMIFTIIPWILDLTYYGIIRCRYCISVLEIITYVPRFFGMSHKELWEFVTSGVGVVITIVSIFFTFAFGLYDRFEEKIFGIPRKELLVEERKDRFYGQVRWMVIILPVYMVFSVCLKACAVSYCLLLLSYVLLVIMYSRYRKSYMEEAMMAALCQKLLRAFRDLDSVKDMGPWREFYQILDDIHGFVKKERDWSRVQKLFFRFLDEVRQEDDDVCFVTVYYFMSFVFGWKNPVHEFDAFRIVEQYMGHMKYDGTRYDYADSKDAALLWGMLAALIPHAKEDELVNFFEYFSDFENRSRYRIQREGVELSEYICQKESAMVLMAFEEWLVKNDSEKRELAVMANKIYIRGKSFFSVDAESGLRDTILLYGYIHENPMFIETVLKIFEKEDSEKFKKSNVAYLIQSI